MACMTPSPQLSRRTLLGGSATVLATMALPTGLAQAAPHRPDAVRPSQVFTFFTDPHADPENAVQMLRLGATLEAMAADDPAVVLHGGDVTEYGTVAEYRAYLDLVPPTLRHKIEHVPGNHEIRWDVSAYENYTELVDPTNFAVTVGGVHFRLLDPTVLQLEVGYYSQADLAWVRETLQAKPRNVPTVLVTHYPQAEGQYYVVNPEDLLAAIEGRNVRAVLAGHTHRQRLELINGLTHLEGAAVKNRAQYYRLTTSGAGQSFAVTIEHVDIPDPQRPDLTVATELATVDLGPQPGRHRLDPRSVEASATGGILTVRVGTRSLPPDATAQASLYRQEIYAGSTTERWVPLARSGDGFTGTLDVSALPPGEHRVNVEILSDGERWREVLRFDLAGAAFAPLWEYRLGDIITGATAQLGSRIFVPSPDGTVVALEPTASGPGMVWSSEVGPIYTNVAVWPQPGLVVAGSSAGAVTALRAADGSVAWRRDLGRPVMSNPHITTIDGRLVVVVMAEEMLVLLDGTSGAMVWQVAMPGVSAGRVAADDERIYLGLGDGKAWAVDAATAALLWSTELANRAGSYRKLIYGPWTHQVELITPDLVFVSTVAGGRALDRRTGAVVWQIPKSYLYTPVRILDGGDLLLIDEWGEARRVDAATGATRWVTPRLVSRSLDAARVVLGDRALVPGAMGDLTVIDLATGAFQRARQLSVSPIISSPSVANDVLVVGHLDGIVRGYAAQSVRV